MRTSSVIGAADGASLLKREELVELYQGSACAKAKIQVVFPKAQL
jgi:hypothetical protein